MTTAKAKKLALIVNTVILMLVFGLMGFFAACSVTFLVFFSIPAALVYVIGYWLIYRNRLEIYVRLVYSWLTFYMGVTTVCLGYSYGFHLYCFSMIPVLFVTDYMSYKLKHRRMKSLMFSFVIAVFYLICTGYTAYFGPVYHRDQKIAAFFWVFNAICVFGFLIYYTYYLIRSIIDSEEKLVQIAHTDHLTGLYNRHYMMERLDSLPADDSSLCLAMADIDDFKKINDRYGHNAGDEVLRVVSRKMTAHCPGCDIARWGGEEFLLLISSGQDKALEMLTSMTESISGEPVIFDDLSIKVTLTVGTACRLPSQTLDEWIQSVDSKLYTGKSAGKNQIVV